MEKIDEEYIKAYSKAYSKIDKFANEVILENKEYIFFHKVGDEYSLHCAYCGRNHRTKNKIRHNRYMHCPNCNSLGKTKSLNYGRKLLKNEICFYYYEKSKLEKDTIVALGCYLEKTYMDYFEPEEEIRIEAIYIFNKKDTRMLKRTWKGWERAATIHRFNLGSLDILECIQKFENFDAAKKGTSYEYIPYEYIKNRTEYSGWLLKLIELYGKYPWIEQMCKAGFSEIITCMLYKKKLYNCLNKRGNTIFEVTKLNKGEIKELKKAFPNEEDIDPIVLKMFQIRKNDKSNLQLGEFMNLINDFNFHYDRLFRVLKYTKLMKLNKYINKQYSKYKENFTNKKDVLAFMDDYLLDCKKLKFNLKDENVLFPKDLYKAHQNTLKQVKIKENKELDKKISARLKTLKKYNFEYGKYMIRPAESTYELIQEGSNLKHCVGGYAEKYANGETDILFIRKIKHPEESFYTVEMKKGFILQVRGIRNRIASKEVEEFIDLFKQIKIFKKAS